MSGAEFISPAPGSTTTVMIVGLWLVLPSARGRLDGVVLRRRILAPAGR